MEAAFARTDVVLVVDFAPSEPVRRLPPAPVVPVMAQEIPSAVMALSAALYAAMFAAFGWGFTGAGALGFVAALAIVVLALSRDLASGIGAFMKETLDTATGPVSGASALALVLVVPTCFAAAALAASIAFRALQ